MAEDAVAPLVEGISSCPPEAELHLLLAIALDVGQHSDAAIAEFYRTIEMDPAQTEAYLPLATQLLLADRYQEAWDVAESGRPHIAETASLDMLQGDCARAMGKGEEALALYDRAAETPYYGPAVTQAKENLRAGGGAGHAPDVPQHASVAGTLGTPAYSDATRTNYRTLRRMLAASGVHLVVVQYPLLSTPPLEGLIDDPQVQVVDNGPSFATALEHQPYEALFTDRCYGNFGHATRAGNRILAQNVADAILDLM
jgi:tetratricopeptide (TPR) repeat protein